MSDFEKAAKVAETLKVAQTEPAAQALVLLNELVGLVQGDEHPMEVADARSSAFMAICEVGKALHRGQPADKLWSVAIKAAERWMELAKAHIM